MVAGPALPCPKCRKPLEAISWHDAERGSCWSCKKDFEFESFAALTIDRPKAVPQAVLVAEHATCFYHGENQAETVCEGCGRFVCAVCAVDFGGRRICPPCIAAARETDARAVSQRTLFDGIALALAVLPILFWPLTLATAPAALGVAVIGWRKPRSLVAPRRTKLVVAGVLALAQVVGWILVFVSLWTKD